MKIGFALVRPERAQFVRIQADQTVGEPEDQVAGGDRGDHFRGDVFALGGGLGHDRAVPAESKQLRFVVAVGDQDLVAQPTGVGTM